MHKLTLSAVRRMLPALAALFLCLPGACAQEGWNALVSPDNSFNFAFLKGDTIAVNVSMVGWGPKWAWMGINGKGKMEGDEFVVNMPFAVNKQAGEVIDLTCRVRKVGPRSVAFRYEMSADKDVPLTSLVAVINMAKQFQDGQAALTLAGGGASTLNLSFAGIQMRDATQKVVLQSKTAGDVTMTLDPPCPIHQDGGMRVILAQEKFPQGRKTVTITYEFPAAANLLVTQADLERYTKELTGPDWFPFQPANDNGPSVISTNAFLDAPAGKHGGVRMVGDHFQFEDGTPVKFWGMNLSYGLSAPEKAMADASAARYAKYGVNCIRMHKFTGPGWEGIGDPNDATKMLPQGLDRLDYFTSQLAKNGIYYGWSHTYGFKVCPGNRDRLIAYDEIAKNLKDSNTYAFINIAPDVQDLMIERVVNLLKHRNPYTGKTYAEDPALAYIELQNEDDIFFYTNANAINACPTYKKLLLGRWADFLKAKYNTQEGLKAAWGDALKAGETLDAKDIGIEGNPWFFSDGNLPGQKGGARQRLLDNAAFFHAEQDHFYGKFVKAIRDAGYKGPLCGSPWQAPSMLPHYYNLLSDYQVGFIDRHNYFGGGNGLFDSMLSKPGSGYLSSGLQQVVDRPFGISEWIHVYPSLYSAEGPAIMAAYGMGLQGWDESYEFQSNSSRKGFADIVGNFPWGVWEGDVPTQIGQYPALARMVLRGDVKESPVISLRKVAPQDLATGKFNFSDTVQQQGDVKTFGGSVPPEALAAGRVAVQFVEQPEPSTFVDMAKYDVNKVITSTTGQLAWDYSGKGFFTINTPGTKAVVGFAEGKDIRLGGYRIRLQSPYASLFVTALEPKATLDNAKSALVSVVARNCNSDFRYFAPDNRVLNNGKGPILLEPVKATIALAGRQIAAVNVLDQDGRRTDKTLPVTNGAFAIDGARDRTLYYEVVFK